MSRSSSRLPRSSTLPSHLSSQPQAAPESSNSPARRSSRARTSLPGPSTPGGSVANTNGTPRHAQLAKVQGQEVRSRRSSGVGTPSNAAKSAEVVATPSPAQQRNLTRGGIMGGGSPSSTVPKGGLTPRAKGAKRLVKTRSLGERLADLPTTLSLSLSHTLVAAEEYLSTRLGYPLGISLNLVHLLFRYISTSTSSHRTATSSNAEARLQYALQQAGKIDDGRGRRIAHILSYFLVLVSLLNLLWVSTRRRTYTLQLRRDPIASPRARPVNVDYSLSARMAADRTTSTEDGITFADVLQKTLKALWVTSKFLLRSLAWSLGISLPSFSTNRRRSSFGASGAGVAGDTGAVGSAQALGAGQVYQLDVWDPPEVGLGVLTTYSPAIALLWLILDFDAGVRGARFIAIWVAVVWQTRLLMAHYRGLLEDRHILNTEVMHEYDSKFVNPRIHPPRRDVGTMTHFAEFLDPEDWMAPGVEAAKKPRQSNGRGGILKKPIGGGQAFSTTNWYGEDEEEEEESEEDEGYDEWDEGQPWQ